MAAQEEPGPFSDYSQQSPENKKYFLPDSSARVAAVAYSDITPFFKTALLSVMKRNSRHAMLCGHALYCLADPLFITLDTALIKDIGKKNEYPVHRMLIGK